MEGISKTRNHCTCELKRFFFGGGAAVAVALLALGAGLAARRFGLPLQNWQIGLGAAALGGLATLPFLIAPSKKRETIEIENLTTILSVEEITKIEETWDQKETDFDNIENVLAEFDKGQKELDDLMRGLE